MPDPVGLDGFRRQMLAIQRKIESLEIEVAAARTAAADGTISMNAGRVAKASYTLNEQLWDRLEQHYRHAPVGLCVVDEHLRYRRVNENLAEMNGVPVEAHLGRPIQEVVPGLAGFLLPHLERVLVSGEPVLNLEVSGTTTASNQPMRFWLANIYPLRCADGQITGLSAAILEITEIKRVQQALESSERMKAAILNGIKGVLVCNVAPDMRIVWANDGMIEAFGRGASLEGLKCHKIIAGRAEPCSGCTVLACFATGEPKEREVTLDDGRIFCIRSNPLKNKAGEVTSVVKVAMDVTAQRRAEQMLVAQRDLALALQNAPDLNVTLRLCIEAAIKAAGMDCGGIYLVDPQTGALDLAFSSGLSEGFVKQVSHYAATEANTRVVMAGKPIYGWPAGIRLSLAKAGLSEGLKSLAVVPIWRDGTVIGSINVSSHTVCEVPHFARAALETVAEQVGNAIYRSQTQEALNAYRLRLQSLASELSLAEEKERKRIGTYLHDEVGQLLALAKLKMNELCSMLAAGELKEVALEALRCVVEAIAGTRDMTHELTSSVLYELGLPAALESLTQEVARQGRLSVSFYEDGHHKPVDRDSMIILFRCAREVLLNVIKHARAKEVEVQFVLEGKWAKVVVCDDGVGFEPMKVLDHAQRKTFGLFSVEEQLRYAGGRFTLKSAPGEGTSVSLEVPVTQTSAENSS